MPLVLTAILHDGKQLPQPLQARFGEAGGTLGRGSTNHFVLPDPSHTVSRVQGAVRQAGNHFEFEQQGQNAIKHNNRTLRTGARAKLAAGDRLIIGPYTIVVDFEHDFVATDATLFGRGRPEPQAGIPTDIVNETQFSLPVMGELKADDPVPEPALRTIQEVSIDSTMMFRMGHGQLPGGHPVAKPETGASAKTEPPTSVPRVVGEPLSEEIDDPSLPPTPVPSYDLASPSGRGAGDEGDSLRPSARPASKSAPSAQPLSRGESGVLDEQAIESFAPPEAFALGLIAGLGLDPARLPVDFDVDFGRAMGAEIKRALRTSQGDATNDQEWLDCIERLSRARLEREE